MNDAPMTGPGGQDSPAIKLKTVVLIVLLCWISAFFISLCRFPWPQVQYNVSFAWSILSMVLRDCSMIGFLAFLYHRSSK
jgi:hypothetical protein